jgi:tetrahydromethanopterin S-methyltransferase subunit F
MPRPDVEAFIDGNARGYEKAMADIRRITQQTARGASAEFNALSSRISGMARGVVASLAAIGVGFSIDGIRNTIKEIADIGDVADKVGVTTDALQELRYAAEQTGASADTLDQAMAGFSKRIAEVAAGAENDLSRVLKANNVQLRDQEGNLRKQIDVLRDYANLVKNARNEQDKLRLTTLAFGDRGGDLVGMLRGGADALAIMSRQAENLGQVLSSEAIAKADELDKRFDAVANTIETKFKEALIETVDFIDQNVSAAGRLIAKFEQFSKIPAPAWIGGIFMTPGASANPASRAGDLVGGLVGQPGDANAGAKGSRLYQALSDDAFNSRFSGKSKSGETIIPPEPKTGGSKSNRPSADDRVKQDIQAIKDRTAALTLEREALGLSFKEQQQRKIALELEQQALKDVREEARRKGDADWQNAKLSPSQVAAIQAVSQAYAEQADALRKATENQQLQRDLLKGAFGDLRSALDDGKLDWQDLGNVALNALDKIIDKIENDLIDAIIQANSAASGGSGIFGSLLGILGLGSGGSGGSDPGIISALGLRENGGPVTAGKPYIVGEKRAELFVPRVSGTIVPRLPDMDSISAQAQPSQVISPVFAPQISIRDKDDVPDVLEQMKKFEREFTGRVVKSIREAKTTGLLK